MNRKALAALMVALTVFAPGAAMASETVAFGGNTASTADQVNQTEIQVNSSLDNITVQMTEDQSLSAGGSVFYETAVTPEEVNINASSGTGNLTTNITDNGFYVNETGGSTSATSESVNATFSVSSNFTSNGTVPDAINVSEGNSMLEPVQLIADDDASETHNYRVYGDDNGDVLDWEVETDNGHFNETTNEYVPNETGTTQFTLTVTRNNTTYENLSLEDHLVHVSFDKSGFADISEETNETAGVLELASDGVGDFINDSDEDKGYKFSLVEQNNTSRTYTLQFNATVENADESKSLVVKSIHDPKGGLQASAGVAYGLHNTGSANNLIAVPISLSSPLTLALGGLAVVIVIGGVFVGSDRTSGMRGFGAFANGGYPVIGRFGGGMNLLWLGVILGSLSMIAGPFVPFHEGILVDGLGIPSWGPKVLGFVGGVVGSAIAFRNSDSR